MKWTNLTLFTLTAATLSGCTSKQSYASYELYPVRSGDLTEMVYSAEKTSFAVWAPTAEEVQLMIYADGHTGLPTKTVNMKLDKEGTWKAEVKEDLKGSFYTFTVKVNGTWLGETPGINAKAVGVNGKRAAIIDFNETNPVGWENDKAPLANNISEAVIYELHHRDFSIHPSSGITNKGKFLALTEAGKVSPDGLKTGIDHLVELGITHLHILPSYDYASVDETKLADNVYNWGYDPVNYNVPEGSYATDPYNPISRIKEFKEMVQALHQAGIRVVLDVVYNHTFNTDDSAFERTAPGYFYRQRADGSLADGSACGNETASERGMMRKYMVESVEYWMNEYHIDGFRFDLMGIHDVETMNLIHEAAVAIDPQVLIYGEGWAAEAPQMEADQLAMKANTSKLPGIAAFSDEMRDALRGPYNNDEKGAFLAGIPGEEESIKFGIAGAIQHPQINYELVNYSQAPWATEPTQMISYVSCHDDMCLVDRLKSAITNIKNDELKRLDKLAQTAVFTSQGIPFIYAGEEVMRDKQGVHNSYKSPDAINQIDWSFKSKNNDVFNYYKGLIELRKNHPAFRMASADLVREKLVFLPVAESNVVAFQLKDHANGDSWKDIIVVLNAQKKSVKVDVPAGKYTIVCKEGVINQAGLGKVSGTQVVVSPQSALIIYGE
ncbi:MAG: type I pullulanase [Phocaeicola sp.]